jgi:hypothetical protein
MPESPRRVHAKPARADGRKSIEPVGELRGEALKPYLKGV